MARMTTEVAVTPERAVLADKDVRGLKYLRHLLPLFARLHEVGCERDKSANRKLHFDQYCALVMLYLFNPLIDSMRALQHASELPCAKKMGLDRFSLGSFSEAPGDHRQHRLQLRHARTRGLCLHFYRGTRDHGHRSGRGNPPGSAREAVVDELNKADNTGVKLRAKEALWKKIGA